MLNIDGISFCVDHLIKSVIKTATKFVIKVGAFIIH